MSLSMSQISILRTSNFFSNGRQSSYRSAIFDIYPLVNYRERIFAHATRNREFSFSAPGSATYEYIRYILPLMYARLRGER